MVFVICAEDQRTKADLDKRVQLSKGCWLFLFAQVAHTKHVQKSTKILSVNNSAARWNAARRSVKIEN